MSIVRPSRFRANRLVATCLGALLVAASLVAVHPAGPVTAATTESCTVDFNETVTADGFTHPGVGFTADILRNARTQIVAGANPWKTYFDAMATSPAAAKNVTSANASSANPSAPDSLAFNSQGFNQRFIGDGLKAYTQALMYVFTGDQAYRTNAMKIIRIWSQMDPAQYTKFTDSHIHTGIPLNRMVTAAEILRYGSCDTDATPWTQQDTDAFTANLITPVIETFQHDQNQFMNQHLYPLLGAMAGYIFTNNANRYAEAVEWFTVNETAADQGFNGSVARLFRLVEEDDKTGQALAQPRVQHVEMGRDQAHGGGDITNAYMLSRLMMAQGTKVDPVEGTISTSANAVGPYEFLNDRILDAANYFWTFMLGRDVEWSPVGYAISADGTVRDTYDRPSSAYRGRFNTAGFWDLYYYYTYDRGVDLTQRAPGFVEAFEKRLPSDYYYNGKLTRAWDNVDGGGDFWIYASSAAAGTAVPEAQTNPTTLDIEDRFTALQGNATVGSDNAVDYVSLPAATSQNTKIAFMNGSTTQKRVGLRVRTDEPTSLRLTFGLDRSITIPDTGGAWRDVIIELRNADTIADLLYIENTGSGDVDVNALLIDPALAAGPTFERGNTRLIAVVGDSAEAGLASTTGSGYSYTANTLPAGATLNANTGKVIWAPTAAGQTRSIISAVATSVAGAASVDLVGATTRQNAIAAAQNGYDSAAVYTRATRSVYDAAYTNAVAALQGDAAVFTDRVNVLAKAVDDLRLVSPRTSDGTLDYPGLLSTSTTGTNSFKLVDNDNQTGTVYSQATALSHIFDFGPFARVSATAFDLQSNIFEDRIANAAVFGSNDRSTWTRLTPGVTTMTQDLQTLQVDASLQDDRFQYLKVQILQAQPDVLRGEVQNLLEFTEFHIHGDRHESVGDIERISVSAPGSLKGRVVAGSQVELALQATAPISNVRVQIAGVNATVTAADGNRSWTARAVLPNSVATGVPLAFTVNHTTSQNVEADPMTTTTDGSGLYMSSDTGLADDRLKTAPVLAPNGTASTALATDAAKLWDRNISTFTDTRVVAGRATLEWDLGAGKALSISAADLLVRQDQYGTSRLSTLRFEGSNDRQTWTPLTSNVRATPDWQRLNGLSQNAFRYIRLTNGNIINLAEVRLFGTEVSF